MTSGWADFDFDANPNINPATIHTLGAGCGWIRSGQSLCLIGDSGTGKSHYADVRIMPICLAVLLRGRVIGPARSA